MTGSNLRALSETVVALDLSDDECRVLYGTMLAHLALDVSERTWSRVLTECAGDLRPLEPLVAPVRIYE
jgi:hypothetical protein